MGGGRSLSDVKKASMASSKRGRDLMEAELEVTEKVRKVMQLLKLNFNLLSCKGTHPGQALFDTDKSEEPLPNKRKRTQTEANKAFSTKLSSFNPSKWLLTLFSG